MKNNTLTIVTGLFDIGRGDIKGFGRKFEHYKECFARLLNVDLPMVIYTTEDLVEFIYTFRGKENTHIILKTIDDLKSFPFYEQTNAIRKKDSWRNQAGWIPDSPQSALELYNPIVMSKHFWLNDASIFNPFGSKYFLWVDAGISNTIGNPAEHLNTDFVEKISPNMNKMLYICYPYDKNAPEVHGFEGKALHDFCGEKRNYVARGGMFGGSKDIINKINGIYYDLLYQTLNNGLMGTEESIFTIITYRHPDLCHIEEIEDNGLIITFLDRIKQMPSLKSDVEELVFYILTYNLPKQLEMWIESFKKSFSNDSPAIKKYLINNSDTDDQSILEEYDRLCKKYNLNEIKFPENIGINDARQFAAEHFDNSGHKFMIFFEDDMLLCDENEEKCKSGFRRYDKNIFDKCIDIMLKEKLDYLKLSFSEFFGDNYLNWAYSNVPDSLKKSEFPEIGDGSSKNSTKIFYMNVHQNVPYAVGEFHYCNWPLLFNKEGNKKVFLDTIFEHKYEQTWMSHVFQLIRKGRIRAGSLLMSVINHNRKYHYPAKKRKENRHA